MRTNSGKNYEISRRPIAIGTKALAGVLLSSMLCSCAVGPAKQLSAETNTDTKNQVVALEPIDVQKYEEVRHHLLNKEYLNAEEKLRAIVEKYPTHSSAWANLGLIYSETKRPELAEKALEKSIALDKKNTGAYLRLALVYKERGRLADALKIYKQALDVDANHAKAHYNIAILYDLYLQDKPAAITHLKKYLAVSGKEDEEIIAWIKQMERDELRQQTAEHRP